MLELLKPWTAKQWSYNYTNMNWRIVGLKKIPDILHVFMKIYKLIIPCILNLTKYFRITLSLQKEDRQGIKTAYNNSFKILQPLVTDPKIPLVSIVPFFWLKWLKIIDAERLTATKQTPDIRFQKQVASLQFIMKISKHAIPVV